MIINSNICSEVNSLTKDQREIDSARIKFMLKRKIRGVAGRRRLGSLWLVLNPILLSLVYVFVFTVIRSRPDVVSMFIGISMYNIFGSSFKSGVNSVKDFSGGIKGERVRTRVIAKSMVYYRLVDAFFQSAGVSALMLIFFEVEVFGVLWFSILCLVIGILSELVGLNLSLLARRVPDITNLVNYGVLLMFFASPCYIHVVHERRLTSSIRSAILSKRLGKGWKLSR